MIFLQDVKHAVRSLARAKGLALTVVVTLALGIGANAAIFSVVRGVLLRPLVNRDEDRLIYIRQSAPGIGAENIDVLGAGDRRPASARHDASAPSATSRPSTSRWSASAEPRVVQRGRRRRVVLRRDGPAPGARPPARRARRRSQGGGRGGADAPLLDDLARQRPDGDRQDHPARRASRDDRRRPRAVGAVSGGHRDHRQRGDEPASPRRDDGDRPRCTG